MTRASGSTAPSIALIWAEAHDRVIGAAGGMPWHVPEDLAHFKELTAGGTVVMGRKTWDALDPRFQPLPGRRNIVVTRDPEWSADGAQVAHSLEDALAADGPLWVIGGAELLAATIDRADRLEVTELDLDVDGDTWAPPIGHGWTVIDEGAWQESRTGVRFRFLSYARAV
jgi:dihydrofolate reductase